ncbi:MAG: hypothetical protein JO353_12900, partial [Phycisphaerae bacterium]|nr:hypothetical protein [Phycisphaerae bacterium]
MVIASRAACAATVTVNPGDNVAVRLSGAQSGDVVQFAAGTFNLGAIAVPSGVTLQGAQNFASHLVFQLSGQDLYGLVLLADASNVTITGFDIVSSNGVLGMYQGSGYSHIHFTNNHVQHGGGTTA